MADRQTRTPASAWLVLGIVMVLAAWLRFTGLDRLTPHVPEPDAYMLGQAEMLRAGPTAEDRESLTWAKYPHLLARLIALAPLPAAPAGPVTAETLDEHLAAASAVTISGRRVVALVSLLGVPLTFLLARRFLSPWPAVLAAALCATSLLHLSFSQQARPHGPLATFTLAAVLGAMAVARTRGRLVPWAASGVAFALAVGCLHSGLALVPALVVAACLAWRGAGAAGESPAGAWLGPWIPPVLAALAWAAFWRFEVSGGGHEFKWAWFNGGGFLELFQTFRDYDPSLGVLVVLGLVASAVALAHGRSPRGAARLDLLVALAFTAPYLLVFGLFAKSFERFFLPLYPFFACLAAGGVAALAQRVSERARPGVAMGTAAACLALPLVVALRYTDLHDAPDTYELAALWLEEHADPGEELLLLDQSITLPVVHRAPVWLVEDRLERMRESPWRVWSREHLAQLRSGGVWDVRYLLSRLWLVGMEQPRLSDRAIERQREEIDGLSGTLALLLASRDPEQATFIERILRPMTERVLSITASGARDGPRTEVGYEKECLWLRVLRTERWGPTITVYRVFPLPDEVDSAAEGGEAPVDGPANDDGR